MIFRLGRVLKEAKGPGLVVVMLADRPHGQGQPAHGGARHPAAGRDHPRQRVGQGQRGRLLPGHQPDQVGRRGRELHLRHLAARPDHPARGARRGRARRAAEPSARRSTCGCRRSSTSTPIRGASRCRWSRSSTSTCRRRCSAPSRSRPRRSARSGPRSSTPRASSWPRRSWPQAADVMIANPVTIQLRYLQTLTEIVDRERLDDRVSGAAEVVRVVRRQAGAVIRPSGAGEPTRRGFVKEPWHPRTT